MYERWFSPSMAVGRTLVLVAWDAHDISDELTAAYVDSLGPVREGVLRRDGTVIRQYYYRLAYGFRSVPLAH